MLLSSCLRETERQVATNLRSSQPTWAVSLPITGSYYSHRLSPFIIITQSESWYSFYYPMEGRRQGSPVWPTDTHMPVYIRNYMPHWVTAVMLIIADLNFPAQNLPSLSGVCLVSPTTWNGTNWVGFTLRPKQQLRSNCFLFDGNLPFASTLHSCIEGSPQSDSDSASDFLNLMTSNSIIRTQLLHTAFLQHSTNPMHWACSTLWVKKNSGTLDFCL